MKRVIQPLIGLLLGAFLIWLLFRNTDWAEVGAAIRNVHVGWLLAAQIPLWLTFPTRVQRWTYIVRAVEPVSYRSLFSATQIGFLANFTLPGRIGEVIRAVVLSRLTPIPFSRAFALVALDRVTDLFGLMAILIVSVLAFRPDADVVIPRETFGFEIVFRQEDYFLGAQLAGVGLVGIVGAFVLLYTKRALFLRISDAVLGLVSKRFAAIAHRLISQFAEGFEVFRMPSDMAKSIGLSLVTWGLALLSLAAMLNAFRIDYPWYTPFVMQAMIAVFISAPGAPGFVGQYHAPIVLALVMLIPGTNLGAAKAVAIIVHLIQLPPIALTGAYCLMREQLAFGELRREGTQAKPGGKSDSDEG